MDELFQHPKLVIEVLAAYWAFSAIVTGQPKPDPKSYWGNWLYDSLHLFAGNVQKLAESRIQTLSKTVQVGDVSVTDTKTDVQPIKKDQ